MAEAQKREDEKNPRHREIDIMAMAREVLRHGWCLLIFLVLFGALGVVVALDTQKVFTSDVVLAPEMDSGGLNLSESLSDMASSFGIDLGGSKQTMDAIYPQIYPDLFASNDFILPLLGVEVQMKDSTQTKTYLQHLTQDVKTPFWRLPQAWLAKQRRKHSKKQPPHPAGQGLDPFRLTQDEEEIVKGIKGSISCLVDKKTSVITISVTDTDPQVAAIMADTLQKRLQSYITKYRTKKARKDVAYYRKLLEESKAAYDKAQRVYANYADSNQDATLETIRSKESELENEMQLKFNVYSQMQTQLQQARAKVQEKTPAFTTLQNATVPNRPSGTPRSMIVFIFLCLGIAADALFVLWLLPKMKRKKAETSDENEQDTEPTEEDVASREYPEDFEAPRHVESEEEPQGDKEH